MIPYRDNIFHYKKFPFVVSALILVNAVIFLYELIQISAGNTDFLTYALYTTSPSILTLFSYQFLHGGWIHLLGNMIYLWVFGRTVEDAIGPWWFLLLYLAGGFIGGTFYILLLHSNAPLVGASASIAGIMGAYAVWFTRAQIRVLIPIIILWTTITLPVFLVIGLWFLTNLLNGYATIVGSGTDNIAYVAHIGGFAFGIVVALIARLSYAPRYESS